MKPTLRLTLIAMTLPLLLPTPPATSQTQCPFNVVGSLAAPDGAATSRVFRDDPASTCAAAVTCGVSTTAPVFFDTYTFMNANPGPACITVNLAVNCTQLAQQIQSSAHTPSYNPAAACTNYIADIGTSVTNGANKNYSFNVAGGATFVVAVYEAVAPAGCTAYTLNVTGCDAVPVALQGFDVSDAGCEDIIFLGAL